jgi:hypothetical protein
MLYKDNNIEHKRNEEVGKDSEVQDGSKEQAGRQKIPQRAWISLSLSLFLSFEVCVFSGRNPSVELITRPEEFYRGWLTEYDP